MTLAELTPDMALKALLNGKVKAESKSKAVKVYAQGEQPNTGIDTDYVTVLVNGVITSRTKPLGLYTGNIALTIYCKLNADTTMKLQRMRRLVGQCVELVNCKSSEGFFFELDPANVITPPTPNNTIGYAATTLNVAWRSRD